MPTHLLLTTSQTAVTSWDSKVTEESKGFETEGQGTRSEPLVFARNLLELTAVLHSTPTQHGFSPFTNFGLMIFFQKPNSSMQQPWLRSWDTRSECRLCGWSGSTKGGHDHQCTRTLYLMNRPCQYESRWGMLLLQRGLRQCSSRRSRLRG